jgi:hypothetical protein
MKFLAEFKQLCRGGLVVSLTVDCHRDSYWDFLYVAAPLKIVDGSGL